MASGADEHHDLALAELEIRLQLGEAEHAVLEGRALVERLRKQATPARLVRAMALLAGAYTQLGLYRDAVSLLDEAARDARSGRLEAEVVRMGVTAAAVLVASGQAEAAVPRLKAVRCRLDALMRSPVDATMKAAHNFAFVCMDLGLHSTAEDWFERVLAVRERFASPRTALHTLSAYARLCVEMGLVERYLGREEQASRQFARAARLARLLAEQSDDAVWTHTGIAFTALAWALDDHRAGPPGRRAAPWDGMDSQTNKHLRCVARFASAATAAVDRDWPRVLAECAVGLPLSEDIGFTLFGLELSRLTEVAARAQGEEATAAQSDARWKAGWRSYEWTARLRAAEFAAP